MALRQTMTVRHDTAIAVADVYGQIKPETATTKKTTTV